MMEVYRQALCNINSYFGIRIRKVGRKGGGEGTPTTTSPPSFIAIGEVPDRLHHAEKPRPFEVAKNRRRKKSAEVVAFNWSEFPIPISGLGRRSVVVVVLLTETYNSVSTLLKRQSYKAMQD